MAPLKAGGQHIPVSITILDQEGMDFLFGLDNLKRHQCNIDLQANKLHFPLLDIHLPFLSEHEIPKGVFNPGDQEAADQKAAPPKPNPPAPPQRQQFDESKIQMLAELGFTREKCIAALQAANGNEEIAASLLFSTGL